MHDLFDDDFASADVGKEALDEVIASTCQADLAPDDIPLSYAAIVDDSFNVVH